MTVRGIYDFEHVGTQDPNNGDQNKREARLGCYHAHKLFEGIKVELKPGKTYPESFDDYKDNITCAWTEDSLPKGVVLHIRHEQPIASIRFGHDRDAQPGRVFPRRSDTYLVCCRSGLL